jgi:hypothetical protein
MSRAWTRWDEKGKNNPRPTFAGGVWGEGRQRRPEAPNVQTGVQPPFFLRAIARRTQKAFDFVLVPDALLLFPAFFFLAGASSSVTNRAADECSYDADGESSAKLTR